MTSTISSPGTLRSSSTTIVSRMRLGSRGGGTLSLIIRSCRMTRSRRGDLLVISVLALLRLVLLLRFLRLTTTSSSVRFVALMKPDPLLAIQSSQMISRNPATLPRTIPATAPGAGPALIPSYCVGIATTAPFCRLVSLCRRLCERCETARTTCEAALRSCRESRMRVSSGSVDKARGITGIAPN